MAINRYNIKKWWRMITGKSILHVRQGVGTCYSLDSLNGYYNDMTEKVTLNPENLMANGIPLAEIDGSGPIVFPITVFQYGLGAYDLYLKTNAEEYLASFITQCNWALDNQNDNGSWTSIVQNQEFSSSMSQGEGASLLLRAYKATGDTRYSEAAKKAIYFMIKDVSEGGTTQYVDDRVYLKEEPASDVIFNGWIFSIWGLYDYLLINGNDDRIADIYHKTVRTLSDALPLMATRYWSKYNMGKAIASPFYHRLHIAQLQVMHEMTDMDSFKEMKTVFEKYQSNYFKKAIAFVVKAWQKVRE